MEFEFTYLEFWRILGLGVLWVLVAISTVRGCSKSDFFGEGCGGGMGEQDTEIAIFFSSFFEECSLCLGGGLGDRDSLELRAFFFFDSFLVAVSCRLWGGLGVRGGEGEKCLVLCEDFLLPLPCNLSGGLGDRDRDGGGLTPLEGFLLETSRGLSVGLGEWDGEGGFTPLDDFLIELSWRLGVGLGDKDSLEDRGLVSLVVFLPELSWRFCGGLGDRDKLVVADDISGDFFLELCFNEDFSLGLASVFFAGGSGDRHESLKSGIESPDPPNWYFSELMAFFIFSSCPTTRR